MPTEFKNTYLTEALESIQAEKRVSIQEMDNHTEVLEAVLRSKTDNLKEELEASVSLAMKIPILKDVHTSKSVDGLYMTQEMIDMLLFEMMSVQTFAMKTMTTEKQEEYMTTQAFYYYDRIIQKEKREWLQSAINYYSLVVSKFPQYKEDIDFLLIENDKEYIIGE